ncbi:hypothetical protein L7F22_029394 [Adiantum nelumboides]|nr:hypothetical protein [Adiantum nelumboides]
MGRLKRKLQTLLPLPGNSRLTTHISFSRLPKPDDHEVQQPKPLCLLKRLGSAHTHQAAAGSPTTAPPKGHLPIRVVNPSCTSDGLLYFIKAEHLNHPLILDLLQRAAEEYGYSRVGALQVTCDADVLEDILHTLNSSSR